MSNTNRHLTWEKFSEMIGLGIPVRHRITGKPAIDLFIDHGGQRIGLRIPFLPDESTLPGSLAGVEINQVRYSNETSLEVATTSRHLYQEFYAFLVSVIDKVQLAQVPVLQALQETLDSWRDLLRPLASLSDEAQLGLRGELWMVRRLFHHLGAQAVDAWTGPLHEPHDFRVGSNEFEVKSTRSIHRVHIISSLEQLVPSPTHTLYILSLQFAPAGAQAGSSLPDEIKAIRHLLASSPAALARFNILLRDGCLYMDEHARHYTTRLQQSTLPALVPVDDHCPRITRDDLDSMRAGHSQRISDVHYRVNLEGLGVEDGSSAFLAVLPGGH